MCEPKQDHGPSVRAVCTVLALCAPIGMIMYAVVITEPAMPYVIGASLATFAATVTIMGRMIMRQHAANRALFARLSSPREPARALTREIEPVPGITWVLSAEPVASRTEAGRLALPAARPDLAGLSGSVRDVLAARSESR